LRPETKDEITKFESLKEIWRYDSVAELQMTHLLSLTCRANFYNGGDGKGKEAAKLQNQKGSTGGKN